MKKEDDDETSSLSGARRVEIRIEAADLDLSNSLCRATDRRGSRCCSHDARCCLRWLRARTSESRTLDSSRVRAFVVHNCAPGGCSDGLSFSPIDWHTGCESVPADR